MCVTTLAPQTRFCDYRVVKKAVRTPVLFLRYFRKFRSNGLDVAVMELVGRNHRSALGVTVQIAFAIGYLMQPAMAIFLRDEFHYQLAALSPNLVFPFLIMYTYRCFIY